MPQTPAAQDAHYRHATQAQVEQLLRKKNYHSLTLPDGTAIPGLIPVEALERRIRAFPIPELLAGRRVLDVGAASGWNSIEMARRGAEVMAIDCVEFEELRTATELFNLPIDYRILDVDELDRALVGDFDYVLFLGVLYHLRHPLLALEKICALTRETAFVESFVTDSEGAPSDACTLEFYETDQLGGQIDNWFGPTAKCLVALCRSAGFVRVKLEYIATERRAGVTCHRRWEAEPGSSNFEPAWLYSAVNNRTNDIVFHTGKDEYLCIYFRSAEADLTPDRMRIEVDGYGVNALTLHNPGKGDWQVNSRLPPGLAPGEHAVRLRTDATRFGNEFRIQLRDSRSQPAPVDAPPAMATAVQPAPVIFLLENSLDRSQTMHGYRSERLVCRFRGAPRNLSREAVFARLDEQSIPVSFLTDLAHGEWQANMELPRDLAPGSHAICIRTVASGWSDPAEFLFEP
ncbi:MAG TPA: methyltransferase domain-containing protein [Bryobacteraceae bacterium]|nr:methyltransferase domain-containing protein [Bryobacteraceae bacterium]